MHKRTLTRRPVMAAMFLGATLAALSPNSAQAVASDSPDRTVADLGRYCTACWRNARVPAELWADCTQDVLVRLLERVPTADWRQALAAEGEERREFLRAIDTVKKRVRRAKRWSSEVDSLADGRARAEQRLADERDAVRHAAADALSPRQQQILEQSFDGGSVNDIATALRMSPARVSDEKYKAIQRLRAQLKVVA